MPNCNICHDRFFTINALIIHLKIIHRCEPNSIYFCADGNCKRNFPSLNSFRKHLKTHVECQPQTCFPEVTSKTKFSPDAEVGHPYSDGNNDSKETHDDVSTSSITDNLGTNVAASIGKDTNNFFGDFKKTIIQQNISFICKLYEEKTFCRKDIQKVMSNVTELFGKPLNLFKKFLLEDVSKKYCMSSDDEDQLRKYLEEFQNMFDNFSTEYLRLKYLRDTGYYIQPVEYVIGQRLVHNKKSEPSPKNYTAQHIPLRSVLEKFFSLPNILLETISYMEILRSEPSVQNIIQTDFWKDKIDAYGKSDIIIPLFIYFDEYESGNPLGSHSGIHKLGAVYCSIACLPPAFQSRVENIFLISLFHSSDLKDFGENMIFRKMVFELNYLKREGISVKLPTQNVVLYFCTALFLGDNLGLNTILGFQPGFRSNHFCRFCKLSRAETQISTTQNSTKLRTKENYSRDLSANNPYSTGVKFSPILNNIDLFHVTENYSVDIAHDIFEGVAEFVMCELLYQFILVDKYFSLDVFNNKLQFFSFTSNHNKPPLITNDNLKKKTLRMSASEMKNLILHAGLIIGYLIPEGNKYWQLYIYLRKILRIVLSNYITGEMCNELTVLINQHHALYMKLFSLPLKPKFHFMTHYAFILEKVGPLIKTMTLRYESKHRQFKLAANVVSSRVNITHTLAVKHQLQLASRFVGNEGLVNSISFSKLKLIDSHISESLSSMHSDEFKTNVSNISRITFNNTCFKIKDIIVISHTENPHFGVIKAILLSEEKNICFIYDDVDTVGFCEHLFAYEVRVREDHVSKHILLGDIHYFDTFRIVSRNDKKYITLFS